MYIRSLFEEIATLPLAMTKFLFAGCFFVNSLIIKNSVMELIIDLNKIKDPSKREWLINSLKLMHIGFQTTEKPQTAIEYNQDLEKGNAEIENGEFTTAGDLKAESDKW